MIFILLALACVIAVLILAFRIRKKQWYSQDFSLERNLAIAFSILFLAFIALHFLFPEGVDFSGEGLDAVVLAQPVSFTLECGENYCFNARVLSSVKGPLVPNTVIEVEVDCPLEFSGEIEIRGVVSGGRLLSSCSLISVMDPFLEEGLE